MTKIVKNKDTLKELTTMLLGSIVTAQRDDSRSLTCGIITEHGDTDHNGRSYKVQINKISRVVKRTARYINTAPILKEQYLQVQISKQNDQYICRDVIYRLFEQNMRQDETSTQSCEYMH